MITETEITGQTNQNLFNFAFIDENTKREIRRKLLKAVAIPGYQVPFASRELPIARGWGTGGLQITMAIIGRVDILKVIDQGCDGVVNAVNLRNLLVKTTGVATTFLTEAATIIQTRHRIPEKPLRADQIIVFQVPYPEPLRIVEPSERMTRQMHGESDYSLTWLDLYERVIKWGEITIGAMYPVMVNDRYIMSPSPIPRWDLPKLHMGDTLFLFRAAVKSGFMRYRLIPKLCRWSLRITSSESKILPVNVVVAVGAPKVIWMKSITRLPVNVTILVPTRLFVMNRANGRSCKDMGKRVNRHEGICCSGNLTG